MAQCHEITYIHLHIPMLILRAQKKILRKAGEVKRDLLFTITGRVNSYGMGSGEVRVLVYHGIVPSHPFRFNSRYISKDLFEQHLQLLSKHCNLISFEDLKKGQTAGDRLNVLLTFDDGFKNNFTLAYPLLKKYRAPALFFVTSQREDQWLFNDVMDVFPALGEKEISLTGRRFFLKRKGAHLRYVNQDGKRASDVFHGLSATEREQVIEQVYRIAPREKFRPYSIYLDLMNNREIEEINSTPGYSIGAHGSTHADLSLLSYQDLAQELHQVQSHFKTLLGNSSSALAFPYGRYNAGVIKAGSDAGFMDFFGTEHTNGNEGLVKPRLTVNPYVSAANELYYIRKGSHE